jgi:hypothetical protein
MTIMNQTRAEKRADKAQRKAAARAAADEELVAKLEANARERATKKGLDVDGALLVAHATLVRDGRGPETLVVWPDRVEKYKHVSWGKDIDSVESMLIANVTSVEAQGGTFFVHASGDSMSFLGGPVLAERVRVVVLDLMQIFQSSLPPKASESPMEQIKKLGELRDAGLLSDEEFDAKKKELLDRM